MRVEAGSQGARFKRLLHLSVLCSWSGRLPSLSLSSLIQEVRVMVLQYLMGWERRTTYNGGKHLVRSLPQVDILWKLLLSGGQHV